MDDKVVKVLLLAQKTGPVRPEKILRRMPSGSPFQNGVQFVFDKNQPVDVVVVINYLRYDSEVICREGFIWKWDREPFVSRPFGDSFTRIYSHLDPKLDPRIITSPPILDWWVNKSYDDLVNMAVPEKPKMMSCIASTKTGKKRTEHTRRAEFVTSLEETMPEIDFFGFGRRNELEDKWSGLCDYRYSIAIENTSKQDYWTEKISDCFASFTVPIYYGATNISKYFPSDSFIWLPIDSPKDARRILRDCLENDDWSSRLPSLIEARQLVLNKYSLWAQVTSEVLKAAERFHHVRQVPQTIRGRRARPRGWSRNLSVRANVIKVAQRVWRGFAPQK